MLTLKILLILIVIISGGAVLLPGAKAYFDKHKWLRLTTWAVALVGGIYFFVGFFMDIESGVTWAYQRITIGRYIDRNYSISECDKTLGVDCVRYGGSHGNTTALTKIRQCTRLRLVPSSMPTLKWTSLWITNIFSYAPGGGGPGGGLIDDVLKVGGWGDWYFSLIKFELPAKIEMNFAGVMLYVHPDEQETVPLFVDRIIEPWKWDLTKHIWWKDRPGGFPIVNSALVSPEKNHWYVIEVTKLYNQWVSGSAGNYGFQVRPATNFGSIIRFASNLAKDQTKIPHLVLCPKR